MKIKDLTIIALLIGLSLILSYVKLFGSVALDSVPAFVALFIWKDYKAGFIGGLGHFFTAITSGFVFGLYTHILITLLMFLMLVLASIIIKKFSFLPTFIFILIVNAFIMPFVLFIAISFSLKTYLSFVFMLTIAVVINLIIAYILSKYISKVIDND